MPSGNADTRTGRLKVLTGPEALVRSMGLMERATEKHAVDVTVGNGVLHWTSHSESPGATVPGSRIKSVTQRGAAFVVNLNPGTHGITALTFAAASDADAADWVKAVERVMATPAAAPPSPPVRASRPAAATGGAPLDPTPITVKYRISEQILEKETIEKHYALLVIACDPTTLLDVCKFSKRECDIFGKFRQFTYHTTLVKVNVPTTPQDHAVIFAPKPLEALDGGIYAFRNESAKQFGLAAANGMSENLVTIYQLARKQDDIKELNTALNECKWWPFGSPCDIITSVTTPYFNHFDPSCLAAGLPWELLGLQGQNHTLLVHGSACFESVLHCWTYPNLMLACHGAEKLLPTNLASPIVVLGAGASGLLFAARLRDMGYTNIDILEITDRYGGKTHTVVQYGPYPVGRHDKTVCELGTCYLSPAYSVPPDGTHSSFVGYLQQEGAVDCNHQIDFAQKAQSFRGVAIEGQLPPGFAAKCANDHNEAKCVIDYNEYVVLKAACELGLTNSLLDQIKAEAELALALARYGLIYVEYMGFDAPMPSTPPMPPFASFLGKTFWQFLEDNDLLALVGVLQYGYELQGYGPVKDISAFYGLTWITPAVTWAILLDALGVVDVPLVTAWTRGWGDMWTQLVEKKHLNITYCATVTSITRG